MKQRKEGGKIYCHDWRRWRHGEGQRRAGFGIFLIIIGGLWLGAKLGLFNPDFFWPLAFIAVGTWIIISGQRATGQRATFGSGSLRRGKSGNRSK